MYAFFMLSHPHSRHFRLRGLATWQRKFVSQGPRSRESHCMIILLDNTDLYVYNHVHPVYVFVWVDLPQPSPPTFCGVIEEMFGVDSFRIQKILNVMQMHIQGK